MKDVEIKDLGQFIGSRIIKIYKSTGGHVGYDELVIEFRTGKLHIWDGGQTCCENRYMEVQSELDFFVGSMFLDVRALEVTYEEREGFQHLDTQFLNVFTSVGVVVVANYNSHNGYYGGFYLIAAFEEKEEENND